MESFIFFEASTLATGEEALDIVLASPSKMFPCPLHPLCRFYTCLHLQVDNESKDVREIQTIIFTQSRRNNIKAGFVVAI